MEGVGLLGLFSNRLRGFCMGFSKDWYVTSGRKSSGFYENYGFFQASGG